MEIFRLTPNGPRSFSDLPIKRVEVGTSITYTAIGKEKVSGLGFELDAGTLRVSSHNGTWMVMLISVESAFRNKGISYELLYTAVRELGQLTTSKLLSPAGRKLLDGLVRRGFADTLGPDDYLIHF